MRSDELQLLADQLAQALDEMEQGLGEPAEIATLGGLVARWQEPGALGGQQPGLTGADLATKGAALLTRARPYAAQACAALRATIDHEGVVGLAAGIVDASETDTEDERANVLFELDELFAAAWFCGLDTPELVELADLVVRTVQAFPEVWRDLSALASAVLERHPHLPPLAARALWQAVEAAVWQAEPELLSVPACNSARRALKLQYPGGTGDSTQPRDSSSDRASRPLLVSLAVVFGSRPTAMLQADTTLLPAPPRWQTLDQGEGWELALTVNETDQPILLLSSALGGPARVERDGQEVSLLTPRPGVVTWLAEPGLYYLHVAGEVRVYEVEP